jgi:hypothetical protein
MKSMLIALALAVPSALGTTYNLAKAIWTPQSNGYPQMVTTASVSSGTCSSYSGKPVYYGINRPLAGRPQLGTVSVSCIDPSNARITVTVTTDASTQGSAYSKLLADISTNDGSRVAPAIVTVGNFGAYVDIFNMYYNLNDESSLRIATNVAAVNDLSNSQAYGLVCQRNPDPVSLTFNNIHTSMKSWDGTAIGGFNLDGTNFNVMPGSTNAITKLNSGPFVTINPNVFSGGSGYITNTYVPATQSASGAVTTFTTELDYFWGNYRVVLGGSDSSIVTKVTVKQVPSNSVYDPAFVCPSTAM